MNNTGAFQRPSSLEVAPQVPSRQQQYTSDIYNGTMSLEDTIASVQTAHNGFIGSKPDTSHTVGN